MKKLILALTGVVVVAVGFGIYYLASNLDAIVENLIEEHGSEAAGTRVSVSGVHIQLREGTGTISGLSVANPEGFDGDTVFELDDIEMTIDLGSIGEDPIVIESIRVKSPAVEAEILKDGDLNVQKIREHVEKYQAARASAENSTRNIRIESFVLEAGEIHVDGSALGMEPRTLQLAEVRMGRIGGEAGVPPAEASKVILTRIARETAEQIARSEVKSLIDKHLGDQVPKDAEDAVEKAKELINKIGN